MGSEQEVTSLRTVAVQVATRAAELAHQVRNEAVTASVIDTKSSETDVVTAGDRATERLVRELLAQRRPGEAILGEEEGGASGSGAGLRWVVDPIDGTVNYLYGLPWYAVSLAAQVDGRSIAGAVVEPESGRVWSAGLGQGAELNGTTLQVTAANRLDLSLIGTGFAYSQERRAAQAKAAAKLLSQVRDIRRQGAASLDLCAVAAGWLDGYYEHGLQRWDWAAGALIAAEAGAVLRMPHDSEQAHLRGLADLAESERPESDDQLGPETIMCAAPGIAADLREALIRAGVGQA